MAAATETALQGAFVPQRGCSGCPNRGTCHSARQRVQDELHEAGRHYLCEFFLGIERRRAGVPDLQPWWGRFLGLGS